MVQTSSRNWGKHAHGALDQDGGNGTVCMSVNVCVMKSIELTAADKLEEGNKSKKVE